jgi:ligand-binding sensor domain-containing protein/signal transduction histidine kinase/CheY-like chemotaxis protein/AraC-like DNA-binding protein
MGFMPVSAQDKPLYLDHLSVKDGLSQISALSIYEDTEGYLWFGTRKGLNKYDGYKFTCFQELDGAISNSHITCMTEDGDSCLWVGTRRGLNRYDRLNNTFTTYFYKSEDTLSLGNNTIHDLCRDSKGALWIGTGAGLNLYIKETDNYLRNPIPGIPLNKNVYSITEDKDGQLWIGTDSGLYIYDFESQDLHVYYHLPDDPNSLSSNRISALFCDSRGWVWVGAYQTGVCRYDAKTDNFIRYTEKDGLNSNNVRCFKEDKDGILIGTFDGLNVYSPQTDKIDNVYGSSKKGEVQVSNFSIYSLHCDRAGTVWIGTYSGGVNYYNPVAHRFRLYDPGMQGRKMYGIVGPIVEDPDGLWIGTEGGGLVFYDRLKNEYAYYLLPGATPRSNSRNIVKSMLRVNNQLIIGTTQGVIHRFDILRKQFTETFSVPWGSIYYALFYDNTHRLWIGATSGSALGYLKPDKEFVHSVPLNNGQFFNPSNVRCIVTDDTGTFFIATAGQGLYLLNEQSGILRQWNHVPDDTSSLCMDQIYSMIKDRNDNIWIGTPGAGIGKLDPESGKFRNYNQSHGLGSNTVYTLLEDQDGNLWISTSEGISMFDPVEEVFTNYHRNNGVGISEFTPGSGIVTSDNEVIFGGNEGFILFRPEELKSNTFIPPVVITGLSVNNQPENSPERYRSTALRLNHKQSNFTIEFSALNYVFPDQNRYAYKLEGFDREWNEVGNRREAYYTNIQPGHYTFRVKGSNNDGVWNEQGASMQIHIMPPPWATWWAWTLYVLTVLIIMALIVRYARIKTRLENNIRIKQMEQENLEVLHQTKIKLFTGFAHELRTPLTLIMSPLEDVLLRNEDLEPGLQNTLKLMHRNTGRLLNTVNQLMDFRKKESGHLQIKAAQGNIVKFTNEIVLAFSELSRSRDINFTFDSSLVEQQFWYDRDLMEKVIFNLLSNAFKNTPNGGAIHVAIHPVSSEKLISDYSDHFSHMQGTDFVLLEVVDSGVGIPETELEKIFEPFYQVYRKDATSHLLGTGLGLNFSKGVIELHRGVIWADNNPEKGAVFRIVLLAGKEHLKENELEPDYKNSEDTSFYVVQDVQEAVSDITGKNELADFKYTVLIVEDNYDVRHYIKSHVSKYYHTLEAGNGKEAFDLIVEHLPDLVVSDVMMPEMDGIELCRLIKEDLRTGHIPVILLTARVTVMQIQEGFEQGADEYITKPFNAGLLLTRIKNLISSREKLKELFGHNYSSLFPELPTSSIDSRFMDSIYTYILEHMAEPELNMSEYYKEIGMSRSAFYRKLKSLSDLSPVELIRNTRMQFAAKYLKESDLPISEIAYKIGFSSPSYFTKTFKSYFNQSPTEMRGE